MWETGESLPRAEVLLKLSKIFGCSIDEILHGMESKKEVV